jgi:asparagine synthetase B (glutamine-hydrolysing)
MGAQKGQEDIPPDDIHENKRRLRTLLEESVKRRLIADVPLGAFLSGGVDSSIIVALMSRNSSKPVKTFSIGYKDLPSFDETAYAKEAASFNQTEHHEFKLGHREILDVFPQVLETLDEPFADSSAVPPTLFRGKRVITLRSPCPGTEGMSFLQATGCISANFGPGTMQRFRTSCARM